MWLPRFCRTGALIQGRLPLQKDKGLRASVKQVMTMRFRLNSSLVRKAALLVAPLGLLTGGALFAHDSYNEGRSAPYYRQDDRWAFRGDRNEDRFSGNSRAFREQQREEWRRIREQRRRERDARDRDYRYEDRNSRDYRYDNGGYSGRRY